MTLLENLIAPSNSLFGEIPWSLSLCLMVRDLDLRNNSFMVHVLDLSRNNISGTKPDMISEMENLDVLDHSFNELNVSIPQSLSKLTFLTKFNAAHNQLEGEKPASMQFLFEQLRLWCGL